MGEGTDMIENVARAINNATCDDLGLGRDDDWQVYIPEAKAAIAAMTVQAEPVAWMYVRRDDDAWPPSPPRVSLTRWGATGDYWAEIPIPALPTPPAGGSDAE